MATIKKAVNRLLEKHPKVKASWEIMASFLPWCPGRKTPPNGALHIKLHRQWTDYSCTAAVAQMVAHYYGIELSHRKAIELTGCKPDGATIIDSARALARTYGFKTRILKTRRQTRKALQQGYPVMASDMVTFDEGHAILLVGETAKGYWISDSYRCEIYWRHEDRFMAGADEIVAVIGERPVEQPQKRRARRL